MTNLLTTVEDDDTKTASILDDLQSAFQNSRCENLDLTDYLELCKLDRMAYASASERMIKAIGEPRKVDTSLEPRLSRIFQNRTMRVYPAFEDFYGMEDTIERIVAFYSKSAQGLEERKQILYLLGPVGGGKSSLAERLKALMETYPIYVLAYVKDPARPDDLEPSPVFESPLALFYEDKWHARLKSNYGIDSRYLKLVQSPWIIKRLEQANGDYKRFRVIRMKPDKLRQIAVSKTEPGDENNQDISALVGKTDIRMLERYSQNDPDSYSFSGGLCRANQGLLEFVEMFKAPIKVLHPLLTATQEGNYIGTETIGAIPFYGMILAHSNESEWQKFKNNKNNEAFIDRIYVIKVPYCLRVTDEQKIYEKMIGSSELAAAPCAPGTLEMLARWSVLTRLKKHENSTLWSKMKVYDGENIKDTDPRARSVQEYKDSAGVDEGMTGGSTRFAFKTLSACFNHDPDEIGADPVHLMYALETAIIREQHPDETENLWIGFIKEELMRRYSEDIGKEIRIAYLEAYDEFGQNLFDRYHVYAYHWLNEIDFKDPDTGTMFKRSELNDELEKIEKPAGIANPKDFRNECVMFILNAKANNKSVSWTSYKKLRDVIEKKMFANVAELLPIISFGKKPDRETETKHKDFVSRMMERGYTEKMVRRAVEWYMRVSKS